MNGKQGLLETDARHIQRQDRLDAVGQLSKVRRGSHTFPHPGADQCLRGWSA